MQLASILIDSFEYCMERNPCMHLQPKLIAYIQFGGIDVIC